MIEKIGIIIPMSNRSRTEARSDVPGFEHRFPWPGSHLEPGFASLCISGRPSGEVASANSTGETSGKWSGPAELFQPQVQSLPGQ